MRPLTVLHAVDAQDAVRLHHEAAATRDEDGGGSGQGRGPDVVYCAGGTTVVDLLKLGVLDPAVLVDLLPLRDRMGGITLDASGLTIGALARMSDVASHPDVLREVPVVADALRQAASGQLRNAATVGGNLLQRTRCPYFRDLASPCNKRTPGSGCSAIGGDSRTLAVLGTSEHCIANYPGDLAVALVALDAEVALLDPSGAHRTLPVEHLHRGGDARPDLETVLQPGELVTAVVVPAGNWRASVYVKVRDRASYAFALASAVAAVVLDEAGSVADARVAVGGLAARPWRCREAEEFLRGRPLDRVTALAAGDLALRGARTDVHQAFKVELGSRTVARALLRANALAQQEQAGGPSGASGRGASLTGDPGWRVG